VNSTSNYERRQEIARGGMGAVLEARDLRLGRTVAMKVMLPHQAGAAERDRFRQEARVLGRLAHPNIVPIHDVGVDENGREFYTMKLVEGTTLNAILVKLAEGDPETIRQYPLNALLTIFQKVCDAVGFAHARGIIHRDLKPDNIMVGAYGEVLVMDWGLAKFLVDDQPEPLRDWGEGRGPTGTIVLDNASAPPEVDPGTDTVVDAPADKPGAPITLLDGPALGEETTRADSKPLAAFPVERDPIKPEYAVPGPEAPELETVKDEPPGIDAEAMTIADDAPVAGGPAAGAEASTLGDAEGGGLGAMPGAALNQTQMTMEGAVMGTPNYMSPEQAEGKISELDARSDIFSLGGVLYAILTLRPPVRGRSMEEILAKVKEADIPEPTELNSPGLVDKARASLSGKLPDAKEAPGVPHCPGGQVPPPLSAVAMKALQRDPADRYQSVAELAADITAYQNGFATTAENAGLLRLIKLFIQRHKTIAVALLIGLLATIGFMAKIISSERRATQEAARATREANRATAAEQEALKGFALAQTALGEAAIKDLDGLKARRLLAEVPEPLRDSNWKYLYAQADTSIATLTGPDNQPALGVAPVAALPGVFALAWANGRIQLRDSVRDQSILEFPSEFAGHNAPYLLSVAPDGSELAVANWDAEKVVIRSAVTGAKAREWKTPKPWQIDYSPARHHLLFTPEPVAGQPGRLTLYDARAGKALWHFEPGADWLLGAFHPSGKTVVAAYGQTNACLLDALTGKIIRALPGTGQLVYRIATSPDWVLAAFGDGQGGVTVADVESALPVASFRAGEDRISMLEFTPDGTRIVTLIYPRNHAYHHVEIWDAESGQRLQSILGADERTRFGAVHPVSGELLLAGRQAKLWRLAQPDPEWVAESGLNPPRVRFWPDEDSILLHDAQGHPQVLALKPGHETELLWQSPEAFGRMAQNSANQRFALIGGAEFNLEGQGYHLLERGQTNAVRERRHWQPDHPLPLLRLGPEGARVWAGRGVTDLLAEKPATNRVEFDGPIANVEWTGPDRVALVSNEESRSILALAEVASGRTLHSVTNATQIYVLAVSADGRLIAEGGQDRFVRIRRAESLDLLREFRVHDGPLTALAFHPTRPILATASADLTMRLWDHRSGEMLEEIRGPISPVASLDFSPSGRRLVSASANGWALVWLPRSLGAAPKAAKAP